MNLVYMIILGVGTNSISVTPPTRVFEKTCEIAKAQVEAASNRWRAMQLTVFCVPADAQAWQEKGE